MKLQKDLREFIALLNSENVDFVIVGAYALALHHLPRFTGDIDLFVRGSPENAQRLERALDKFGFASTGLKAADFLVENQVIQLGVAPNRIDLLTSIDAVTFEEAWQTRQAGVLDGLDVFFLGREMMIRNKLATGRPQDQVDAERLSARKSKG